MIYVYKLFVLTADRYSVGREMKIQLEFRTYKPNGIILSITDNHAVTLELHEGKVRLNRKINGDFSLKEFFELKTLTVYQKGPGQ